MIKDIIYFDEMGTAFTMCVPHKREVCPRCEGHGTCEMCLGARVIWVPDMPRMTEEAVEAIEAHLSKLAAQRLASADAQVIAKEPAKRRIDKKT